MSEAEAVRDANAEFYRAFESLDGGRMEDVWLRSERVSCTHPGWSRLSGFAAVIDSWRRIFENTVEISFELTAVEVSVQGDLAWVLCTENITTKDYDGLSLSQVEATNVFERHGARWRLVHHHGSPVISASARETPDAPLQ